MKQQRIGIAVGLWAGLYLLWTVLFHDHVFTVTRTLTVQFCYLLFVFANYYVQVYYAIPRLLHRRRYLLFGLCLPACIALSALIRTPLAIWLQVHVFLPGSPAPDAGIVFRDSFLNILIWVIFSVSVQQVIEKIGFRQRMDAMERQRTREELDFLKAQFNPHFLFNSINSIYGHIDKRNAKAREMLLCFSEMLRYQLYECNVDNIVIEKELQYIRHYVALQQERKEENLRVRLDIPETVAGFTIAPLLLITFVENAFKYVSTREDGTNEVMISLKKDRDQLVFRAYNTKDRMVAGTVPGRGGIGIANARRRLDLQYPGRHRLTITDAERSYEVLLNLNIATHVAEGHYSGR
ncbi:MAG TPA: histidine kinase [Puia sp.]|nr:histidine kinase [Puia sp.]